ncbi:MAG: NUDIX hydrolase [Ferruginibacter sp.]
MPKTLSQEYISRHPYFTARKDAYETAAGKTVEPYYVVELPTTVVAMALTTDNEIIFVEQYRHPINEVLMELPGGFIDAGEQPQQAIARELAEETGYEFSQFHYLGITAANPGVLNNFTHMFLATGGKKTGEQKLDDNEEISIHLKTMEQARLMLAHHEVRQTMHALCLFYGFSYLETNLPEVLL